MNKQLNAVVAASPVCSKISSASPEEPLGSQQEARLAQKLSEPQSQTTAALLLFACRTLLAVGSARINSRMRLLCAGGLEGVPIATPTF